MGYNRLQDSNTTILLSVDAKTIDIHSHWSYLKYGPKIWRILLAIQQSQTVRICV